MKTLFITNNVALANHAIKNWILEHCAMELTMKFIVKIVTVENLEDPVSEAWQALGLMKKLPQK